jgi:hypothetical protein
MARGSKQNPQNSEAGARQEPATMGTSQHHDCSQKGKHLSQPQTNNQNPLSASAPCNLADDEAIPASKVKPNSSVLNLLLLTPQNSYQ